MSYSERVPAFPVAYVTHTGIGESSEGGQYIASETTHIDGMDLLDWFAGQAITMSAYHSAPECTGHHKNMAETAYNIAESMMAERKRRASK